MMVSPVRGEFTQGSATIYVAEDPLQTWVTASISTASLDTQNPDRDTHLKSGDFLDTDRFPTLEFRSTAVKWTGGNEAIFYWAQLRSNKLARRGSTVPPPETPSISSIGRFTLIGDLTVRGVTQQVELAVDYGGARRDPYGKDIFGFSASTEINREDFGLVWNVALEAGGVLVGKKVRIEIAGEAIHQPDRY